MTEIPASFLGVPVAHSVRHVTDVSEAPYSGTAWLANADSTYTVLHVYSHDGEWWSGQNSKYDMAADKAAQEFAAQCDKRDRLKRMVLAGAVTWDALAMLRWDFLPVTGRDEFVIYAHYVAGMAQAMPEFLDEENSKVSEDIAVWLSRYSHAHTKLSK